ncbi:MAG: ABC transporter permease [Candidatus Tyrphobacter sp.]
MAGRRLRALIVKEFAQMLHDRRYMIALVVAPVLELLVFGFVLSAAVTNLPLGVVDLSATPESREFVATLSESRSFRVVGYYDSGAAVGDAIARGTLDGGVVIPYGFARDMLRGRTATVQFLLNATNANTAAIAQGYARGVVAAYDRLVAGAPQAGGVLLEPDYLYNPGLVGSWFIVTGILGLLLILVGTLFSSQMIVKERAAGTLEQLLMSPASAAEIIVAKIVPLFTALFAMGLIALAMLRWVFDLPFNGSLAVFLAGAGLCMFSGIGLGMFIATIVRSARQAQLVLFFLNPPLASLSGAFTPIEAMPRWLQPVALFNPINHFGVIARGALIKGSGLGVLWPHFLALFAFTAVLLSLSVWRYRAQL